MINSRYNKKSSIAVITARGGSKRIPKKNIREFLNKPMIAYAIESCLDSKIFTEIMVSTDCEEIADISKKYGAQVPFLRSEKTSDDFATTYDVLEEVLLKYKTLNKEFEYTCCVYPCVPFLTGKILQSAYEKFLSADYDALMPLVKYSYPIQRALKIEGENLKFAFPEFENCRSQDLPSMYHDVGMFYFMKTQSLLREKKIVCNHMTYFEMKEMHIQDIDTLEDWENAELKYRLIHG